MSEALLQAARRLQAISQTGLEYANNQFDVERYQQVGDLAIQLLSLASGHDSQSLAGAFAFERGYATPKIDAGAAVFRGNRILLVREQSDGLWTLPGGWADVGDSPSNAAVREVKEESGFEVKATKLAALYDRDLHGHPPIPYHTYKLIFLCELLGGSAQTSFETDAVDFFAEDALLPLSETRILAKQIQHMFEHQRDPARPTTFD